MDIYCERCDQSLGSDEGLCVMCYRSGMAADVHATRVDLTEDLCRAVGGFTKACKVCDEPLWFFPSTKGLSKWFVANEDGTEHNIECRRASRSMRKGGGAPPGLGGWD
jgi:hypothetical protein